MIRPFTLITMMLAMVSGAYLFAVKHRAQVLDDQLAAVAQNARLDEQRIRVLQAQWALEIDPNRLQTLAAKFSALQPMKPAQLVTLAALPADLPPAGSAAPGANPVAPAMPLIAANDPDPAPAATAPTATATDTAAGTTAAGAATPDAAQVAMLPMPPPVAPDSDSPASPATPALAPHGVPSPAALRAMLNGKTVAARTVRVAGVTRRTGVSHLSHTEWAENLPPPRPLYTQADAGSAPMGARVMTVSASPAAAVSGESQGGSLLGMATDLAPPQPVAGGTGN
jgi:hypothetical protein